MSFTPGVIVGPNQGPGDDTPTAINPTFYHYDENGAQRDHVRYTEEIELAQGKVTEPNSGGKVLQENTWNLRGQLLQAIVGDVTVTYAYNPDGIRIAATQEEPGVNQYSQPITKVTTTRQLVDSNNPTGYQQDVEVRTNGSLTETIIAGLELLSRAGADHDYSTGHDLVTTFYLSDVHSGVRQRFAPGNDVIAAMRYTAFGAIASRYYATGAANDPSNHLYRGELHDPVTGAVYLRQRWYDLENGRFKSVDPFGGTYRSVSEINRYVYVGSDPLNNSDPLGLWTVSGLAIGITLTALTLATAESLFSHAVRNTTARSGQVQLPFAGAQLYSNFHSIKLRGADFSADKLLIYSRIGIGSLVTLLPEAAQLEVLANE